MITQCLSGSSCSSSETATITYDKMDRITKIVYTGPASTTTIQYSYDKDGNLYQRTDPNGTTTYTVDPLNRVTNESDPGSVSYSYAWDDASNMTCFTDSGGNTSYLYNGLNELSDMYENDPSCGARSSSLHTTFGYDNDHSLTKIAYASGVSVNYGLDQTTGRILSVTTKSPSGSTLRSESYTYTNGSSNDTALIQKLVDTIGSSTNTTTYSYDSLNRLLTATTGGTSADPSYYDYVLDKAGNRTSQTVNPSGSSGGTTTYYDLNPGNQLLCRMNTNASCSGSNSTELSGYSYDQAGNELAITGYSDPSSTTFAYNNADQDTSLTPPSESAQTLSYLGTGQDDLVSIGSTTLQNSQLGITQQTTGGATSYYARTPQGLLIDERLPSGSDYNPTYDAQGDITGLADRSGNLVQTITYGPYGENANSTGTLAYSTTNDPFLFQGGYHTAGANNGQGNIPNQLYHYGQRYYDPTTGRWTQTDPLDQIADFNQANRYTFAGDDPNNDIDPTGECQDIRGANATPGAGSTGTCRYMPTNAPGEGNGGSGPPSTETCVGVSAFGGFLGLPGGFVGSTALASAFGEACGHSH